MAKRRKAKVRKPPLDPADVLAGRVEVEAEDLFDLIHEVNPTGRKLPRKVEIRRYALKNRLQSFLIDHFGDRYVVVEATGHPGVVSLNHRSGVRDACHTILGELEPKAAAWVRRQLDLAAAPTVDEREPWMDRVDGEADGDGDGDPLTRGRQALADYDYEAAERHLEAALAAGGGSEAALALLELKVDLLGMDAEALATWPRLSAAAREHPGVRALLALAAARLGDGDRARSLLQGVSPAVAGTPQTRLAEVHVALAAQAVRDRDRTAAERHLELAGDYDPTHPEIPRLSQAIAELRAEDLRGAEEELERRYRDLGWAAVEEQARALADRLPTSDVARRILRQAAAERRRAEIAEHQEAADKAFAEERFDDAERHYRGALDAGGERPDLATRAAEAARRHRRLREEAQLETVRDHFRQERPRDALVAYLALDQSLRRRLRDAAAEIAADPRPLEWLDALDPPASGVKAHAAVAAVLALGEARRRLAAGDARGAVDQLEPHRGALGGLAAAERLLREAAGRIDEERRRRAMEALAAAGEAAAEGRLTHAREVLEALELRDLDAGDRARAESLLSEVRHAETVERLEKEHHHYLKAGDLLAALDRARRLAETAGEPGVEASWRRRGGEIRRRIQRGWRVETVDQATPLENPQGFFPAAGEGTGLPLLDHRGDRLLLANAWDEWVFLRLVDLDHLEVVRRLSLRPPEPLVGPLRACWSGDQRILVVGRRGRAIEISIGDGKILDWQPLGDLLPRRGGVRDALPLAASRPPKADPRNAGSRSAGSRGGASYVWLTGDDGQVTVIDLTARAVSRQLPPGVERLMPIPGPEPRMLAAGKETGVRLYSARGVAEATGLDAPREVLAAAAGPDGKGLLLLAKEPDPDLRQEADDDDEDPLKRGEPGLETGLFLLHAMPSGGGLKVTAEEDLPRALEAGLVQVASSLEEGVGLFITEDEERHRTLHNLTVDGGQIEWHHSKQVPYHTTLVTDAGSRHAGALVSEESALGFQFLDRGRPLVPLARDPKPEHRAFPHLEGPFTCWRNPSSGPTDAYLRETLIKAGTLSATQVDRGFEHFVDQLASSGQGILYVVRTMRQIGFAPELREAYIRDRAAGNPKDAGFAMLAAEPAAEAGRWQEVRQRLEAVEIDLERDLHSFLLPHYYHLLGLSRFYTGEPEAARRAFEQGEEHAEWGWCTLKPLIDLTSPIVDNPELPDWSHHRPLIHRFVRAIAAADRALAGGDAAAAAAALERPFVWRQVEVQTAARLAAAYLATPDRQGDAAARFEKRLALAFFRHAMSRPRGEGKNLPLAGVSWDRERLAELDRRAKAWLDGH